MQGYPVKAKPCNRTTHNDYHSNNTIIIYGIKFSSAMQGCPVVAEPYNKTTHTPDTVIGNRYSSNNTIIVSNLTQPCKAAL